MPLAVRLFTILLYTQTRQNTIHFWKKKEKKHSLRQLYMNKKQLINLTNLLINRNKLLRFIMGFLFAYRCAASAASGAASGKRQRKRQAATQAARQAAFCRSMLKRQARSDARENAIESKSKLPGICRRCAHSAALFERVPSYASAKRRGGVVLVNVHIGIHPS